MVITIASGKGGTGKTTVGVNMAVSLDKAVRFLDCDVEEPNAHLFLKAVINEQTVVDTFVPEVDFTKCTYCGKCGEICRFNAIAVLKDYVLTFPELCHSCRGCLFVCPEKAVLESKRELGVIEQGRAGQVEFIHGRLRIGEAMSPPLIRKVKERIVREQVNIVDAPPGTSCPVIAALKGADFALLVTEPTPFGLNDLILAVEAVRALKMPLGVVLNRAGNGDSGVQSYLARENIPLLLEIPMDRKIAEAYSRGQMIVDVMPEWKEKFKGLYQKIEGIVNRQGNI
ncbi:MAG: ATP-binding protein [Deltaproteobacteria bacterium]|jgi:MinD superfamily P-loop ATPase|nr:ATP-binding protein [Deltaproteobacteria bacterium]